MIKFFTRSCVGFLVALLIFNVAHSETKNLASTFRFIPLNNATLNYYAAVLNQPKNEGGLLSNAKIRIINLGPVVNRKGLDYAPTVSADGRTLYFVSDRPGSVKNDNDEPSHDFWLAKKNDRLDTVFQEPINLDPSNSNGFSGINTVANEGAASIAADRQSLYFTGCDRPGGIGSCDIYKTSIEGDKWGIPVNLGRNVNSKNFDSQPSISADQSRIYFLSSRKGPNSDGEDIPSNFDIWYSDYDDETDEWKPAVNLEAINTKGQDVSPFIGADGVTLFFASDGYPDTYGKKDFYVTRYDPDTKTWSKPQNLGQPINTEDDEQFISLPASGDIIYFSSRRTDLNGYQGNLDIFMAFVPSFFKAVNLIGTVVDECSGDFIPAVVTIKNPITNRTYTDSVTFNKPKFEKIISNDEYGNPKDSVKYINFEITATNPKYGTKTVIQRVDKPKPTDNQQESGKADVEYSVKVTLGQRPVLGTDIKEAAHVTANKAHDKKLENFNGLVMKEVLSWDLYPLLSYVFFDKNSATIPERYLNFENSAAIKEFNFTDSTIKGGTLDKYYHVMNIYAYRMLQRPNAKLVITGTNDNTTPEEKGNIELSKKRAQVVYDYFKNVWNIPAERMTMQFVNLPKTPSNPKDTLGWQENRRVEIYCEDWEVAKPVFEKDPKIFPQPETMNWVLNNGIEEKLIAKRRIEITRNGQPWNTITDDKITPEKIDWNWTNTNKEYPKDEAKYTAKLIVTTQSGAECMSEPIDIPVMQVRTEKKQTGEGADSLYENYSLILFPFNSYDPGPLNDRIMNDYVYNRCQPSSKIEITGHTDIIGLYETNKKLSVNRAGTVYKGINGKTRGAVNALKSDGVGEDAPLYTNDLPEGRFYNRTVQVKITTPTSAYPEK